MRLKHKQVGFTLIEIVLVLAISSLLAIILLRTYSENQRRSRFTDSVEQMVSELEKLRTEANSSYTTGQGNDITSTNGTRMFYGKAAVFADESGTVQLRTLTAANSEVLAAVQVNTASSASFVLPWGAVVENPGGFPTVLFLRSPADGSLDTVVSSNSDPAAIGSYSSTQTATIILRSSSTPALTAVIIINGDTGEISRMFN